MKTFALICAAMLVLPIGAVRAESRYPLRAAAQRILRSKDSQGAKKGPAIIFQAAIVTAAGKVTKRSFVTAPVDWTWAINEVRPAVAALDAESIGVLLSRVRSASLLRKLGLRSGDIILAFNDTVIVSPGELEAAFDASAESPALVLFVRNGNTCALSIKSTLVTR